MIDFKDFNKLEKKLEPIFVPINEEEKYCDEHKISRVGLDNGAYIVGIERFIVDSVYTSINFQFSSGSFYDPLGKQGLHHLTEHLFNRKLRIENQDRKGIDFNASTSNLSLREYIGGETNIKFKNFGLWPVIPQAIQMLHSPVDQYDRPQEVLDGERLAVEKEIVERDSSQNKLAYNYITELVLGKNNPNSASTRVLGSKESIAKIDIGDCRKLTKEIIGSDNLIVSFITEARDKTVKEIEKKLVSNLVDFPSVEKRQLSNPMLKELVDPVFKNGNRYIFDTGLRDGKLYLYLLWLTEADPALPNYWTRKSIFGSSIRKSFHLLSRKYGWSYSDNFEVKTPFWYRTIFSSLLVLPKNSVDNLFLFAQEVERKFKEETLARLEKEIVSDLIEEQKAILLAQPVKQSSRLDWIIEGIEDHNGRIINPDRIDQIALSVKPKDILIWRDRLMATKPAVVVVGDLEK